MQVSLIQGSYLGGTFSSRLWTVRIGLAFWKDIARIIGKYIPTVNVLCSHFFYQVSQAFWKYLSFFHFATPNSLSAKINYLLFEIFVRCLVVMHSEYTCNYLPTNKFCLIWVTYMNFTHWAHRTTLAYFCNNYRKRQCNGFDIFTKCVFLLSSVPNLPDLLLLELLCVIKRITLVYKVNLLCEYQ